MSDKPEKDALPVPPHEHAGSWNTVILNDSINLQSYVVFVMRTHFGYDEAAAHAVMRQVHTQGRSVVSVDSREQAESHVFALLEYGLLARVEASG